VNAVSLTDFLGVLPETLLVLTALVVIVVDAAKTSAWSSRALPALSILGLAASGGAAILTWGSGGTIFDGTVFNDGFSEIFRVLFAVIGILTLLFSPHYLQKKSMRLGEYYALVLTAVFGMMVMVSAANLLLFFLGLETMSISLYILAGLQRADVKSAEAGMKYLIMGAFSSAFLLYGIALMYTSIGAVDYVAITEHFATGAVAPNALLIVSIALLLLGFAFKVAAVPFHFWSPDVYDGSPTTITAFMSTGPKAAAFVALIRVFGVMLGPLSSLWVTSLTVLAILTMTVGNLSALRQTSVKRMLAYSAIAHAGYLLVGIVAGTKMAFAGTGYYLAAYALTNLGAFACLILIDRKPNSGYKFDDFRGVGFSHPVLGAVFTVFLLSLTGVPPTAGFFGKLYVFSTAIQQGHILLAVIALLNSAIGAYYYLRIITLMYMSKPEGVIEFHEPASYRFALVVSSVIILIVGMFPEQLLQLMLVSVP
jgi:NADH-quinone oxidoreductase subunit N